MGKALRKSRRKTAFFVESLAGFVMPYRPKVTVNFASAKLLFAPRRKISATAENHAFSPPERPLGDTLSLHRLATQRLNAFSHLMCKKKAASKV
ncbi:MAG: hypothetical protein A3C50_00755 [Candidatus Staskawiczbacteria bacterium RIFCSPHIGHO2_02_FULL_43_16]|uniref:Uncharacterized protein n=1 Tax=Candidatus Staskawiczbacteria bacterium RIFCSPHIGHO2_01_FULL_41_41 TaxID=1802203 RepID=A0A1G2HUI8_9BACT|nr:MAG: hypothetical protein A2822_00135 [Candidatus Staskawiczbacteria bacterium RIFCSPHIGHO2_01_FULL_41_41]OGZ68285.1 MAG: hypothetical protein A3C50_00755 [Candidatus Staskawiczbacteria bacterium RIFCSPHIGHO2_02_FULL_43_16]